MKESAILLKTEDKLLEDMERFRGSQAKDLISMLGERIGSHIQLNLKFRYTLVEKINDLEIKGTYNVNDFLDHCIELAKEAAKRFEEIDPGMDTWTPHIWNIQGMEGVIEKPPPTMWLVERFLEQGTLNIVYGAPGGHKSNILFDICMSVAFGHAWLPSAPGQGMADPFEVEKGSVFWMDMDNGPKRMKERLHAFFHGHNANRNIGLHDINFNWVSMPEPWLDITDDETYDRLVGQIQALDIKLMVIDNLALMLGSLDENSSEAARYLATLRRVCVDTNCTIAIIHHERKSGTGQKNRAQEAMRGSTSLVAAVDNVFRVEVDEQSAANVKVSQSKARGASAPQDLHLLFVYQWYHGTRDMRTARMYQIPNVNKVTNIMFTFDAIREILADGKRLNQSELQDAVQQTFVSSGRDFIPGKNRCRTWVLLAASRGIIDEEKLGSKLLYSLPL